MPVMAVSGATATVPATTTPTTSPSTTTSSIVSSQKLNIKAYGALALNQALAAKTEETSAQEAEVAALAEDKILKAKADAVDSYFKSKAMPLQGTGMKMVVEAEKNGLDWRIIAAISVRESTGGKQDCIKVPNNAFGWGSCRIGFKTVDVAIETVARNLGGNNPNTAAYYANKTTIQILRAYNPPSIVPKYGEQVIAIMNTIGDKNLGVEIEA